MGGTALPFRYRRLRSNVVTPVSCRRCCDAEMISSPGFAHRCARRDATTGTTRRRFIGEGGLKATQKAVDGRRFTLPRCAPPCALNPYRHAASSAVSLRGLKPGPATLRRFRKHILRLILRNG